MHEYEPFIWSSPCYHDDADCPRDELSPEIKEFFIVSGGDKRGVRYYSSQKDAERYAASCLSKPKIQRSRINIPVPKRTCYTVRIKLRAVTMTQVHYRSSYANNYAGSTQNSYPCLLTRKRRSALESKYPWVLDFVTEVRAPTPELAQEKALEQLATIIEQSKVLPVYVEDGPSHTNHPWGTLGPDHILTYTDAKGVPLDAQVYIGI